MTKAKRNPPVSKFKVGRINATIWRNDGEKGPYLTINFDRRYKDEQKDEWKSSTSFSPDDLNDLIGAAQMAQGLIPLKKGSGGEEE